MRKMYMAIALLLCGMISTTFAQTVELIKIQIGKVERKREDGKVFLSAYGDVYRKKVHENGKSVSLKPLRKIFLGNLQEMRTIERLGWYIVGEPSAEQRKLFRWGKTRDINEKPYTQFLGIKRGRDYQDSNRDDYDATEYEDDDEDKVVYDDGRDDYGKDDDDDHEIDGKELQERINNGYDDDDYDGYDDGHDDDNGNDNDYDDDYDYGYGNDDSDYYSVDANRSFRTKIARLANTLARERNLRYRIRTFSRSFPRLVVGIKNVTYQIDTALRRVPKRARIAFYHTAVERSLRTGNSRGFTYFVKRLHRLTTWTGRVYRTKRYRSGSKYSGQWRYGQKHGYGLYKSSRASYYGQWRYGKRHGQGTYVWSDGAKYIGSWKGGVKHGYGVMVEANGYVFRRGIWRDNEYMGADYTDDDDYSDDYAEETENYENY